MNTNNGWKLVPVEPTAEMWAAVNKLDDQMAAGGYDGKGASIEQVWKCLVETAPEAPPPTVTVDPDPRGVSVGVYQGSSCVYHGAHEVPAPAAGDARAVAALAELVACDNIKKQIASMQVCVLETDDDVRELDALMSDLARRQPAAWDAARSALSASRQEG